MEPTSAFQTKRSLIQLGRTVLRTALGDISQIGTMDAIVNSANHNLNAEMGGVNVSIHKAAGPGLIKECLSLNGCKIGDAKITGAYLIHTKHIIHTVCPSWNYGRNNETTLLKQCYISSLDVAIKNNIHSIAFPLIGAGELRFPMRTASKIAVQTVGDYIKRHPLELEDVVWVLYDKSSEESVDAELAELYAQFVVESNQKNKQSPKNETHAKIQDLSKNKTESVIDDTPTILHCTKDMSLLTRQEPITAVINGVSTMFYLYSCPVCGRKFSNIPAQNDMVRLRIGDLQFTNLHKDDDKRRCESRKQQPVSQKIVKPPISKQVETPITAKDFVVRRAIFKCRHSNHSLQDVQAVFTTISRLGNVNKIRIPAGYCPDCKMYFIMESTYQRIKRSGVPVCRTMDEKTYIKNNKGGGTSSYSALAQESVLKQFGYNVNQEEDLPSNQRKMILAALVDNNVMTKSDIVSYLDYFVNNRKKQKNPDGSLKYGIAIRKWKEDREFIQHYKMGTYKEVMVRRIISNK